MKINLSFPLAAVLLLAITLSATGNPQSRQNKQTAKPAGSPGHQFSRLWKQADSLANLGQPKSALAIVEKIYLQARSEKNDPQTIKAIINRIRMNSDFQESFLAATIATLQKEITTFSSPAKQVLQSILAEVYWKYYQNNQYRFRDRTQVKTNLPDSLETWDPATISAAITRTYLCSLEQADTLQRIPVGKFEAILQQNIFDTGNKDTNTAEAAGFTPTLYDFLAGRALDYFTGRDIGTTLPARRFEVNQPWYFAPAFSFAMNRMLIPADSASPASFALRIFRSLAAFHLGDKDPRALIETELKRFAFVHEKYTLQGKDSLYPDALKQLEQSQTGSPWSTSVSYTLASFLNEQGQLYKPLISELHKWDIRSAIDVCGKAMQRFPSSEGSKNCQILSKTIKEPFLLITTEKAVPVNKPSLALIGFKNLKQLFFRLVRADVETYTEKSATPDKQGYLKFLAGLPAAKSWVQLFPDDGDYQKHQAEIAVSEVPAGFWVLLCSQTKNFSDSLMVFAFNPFCSTQISYISKRNADGSCGYFLLDRKTGLPLKNVRAEVWEKLYNYTARKYTTIKLQNFTSDEQGYFQVPPSEDRGHNTNRFIKLYYKDDFFTTDNFYQYPVYKEPERTSLQTMFYTDRAIYRPGQIIYVKGIMLERTGDNSKLKTNHATKVVFTDVNGQKISEQNFTTNDFGSFNGSFVAPTGVLPGQMTISNESGSTSVSVEEYKRPTFDVSFDQPEGNYKLGELFTITGKAGAFAGNAIDGGQVKYRVVRTARFPFWNWGWRCPVPASPEVEIANGTTTTDGEGKFNLSFTAIPDISIDKTNWPVFDFSIFADVTDRNGETQSVEQVVSVGYNALLIKTFFPEMVNLAKDTVLKIWTTNLNGRSTPALVTMSLQRVRQPEQTFKTRTWERPDIQVMTKEEFHSQFPNDIYADENNPATWPVAENIFKKQINTASDTMIRLLDPAYRFPLAGSYLLLLRATDPFGEVIEVKKYLTAFSPTSREVPVNAMNWFVPLKTSGEPGESARFLIGSKEENVNMIYEIRLNDSLVSREMLKLNNRAMLVEIPIKEQYRGNFSVGFMFVKHNRSFQNSQVISVPFADKKLGISFETFRDKLDPGSKESWKIKISGPGGKPAEAELMAGMYDASLDLIRRHDWSFNLYQRYTGIIPWDVDNGFQTSSDQWFSKNQPTGNYIFHPGLQLNWFGTSYFGSTMMYSRQLRGGRNKNMMDGMMENSASSAEQQPGLPSPPAMVNEMMADTTNLQGNQPRSIKKQPEPAMQIRRDFRETAFFYPTLKTDSSGSLILQFTAPESLTRWKLLGLAHTKNLDYGLIEKELVTRKELMVFPNAPRFVRQGDTVIFSTKIVNLSNRDLAGEVMLALTDAITGKSCNNLIDTLQEIGNKRNQSFNVKKGQSTAASWKLLIPVSSGLAVLQYRITAASENFSDGEERAIPVLTNRMLVTESLPLPVRGQGTFDFTFDKLLKSGSPNEKDPTLKNHKLTLEFASNPAWYAIQALPLLSETQYESADAVFSAYWTNSVAAFIANSNPKIKAVFDAWKNLTPDALLSNLAKNQELKSALLQETPWVVAATSETGRKQKLGLFFDLDNINANLRENLKKLQKLQSPNGGWTWFPGMPENRYITQNIVTGMGKLYHLGITNILSDPSLREMMVKAIAYLDGEMQKDLENLKRYHSANLEANHLGGSQIQYLYARSYFMNDPSFQIQNQGSKFVEAFDFYKQQAAKYWLQNELHLQGMIALALNRLGNKEVPSLILKSLSEKALHSNEMGMYWAGERGYFWYQAPIETQALMVEAFDEIARDKNTVEELKIWLLKQKQTQDWRSPRATLEACYALLLRGTNLLSDDPGVKITLGKEKITSASLADVKKEAGTGYFQVSWTGNDIKPEMGNVTVSKSGEGIAWGAVYWQYFENLDKITPAATPMKLEKKLFIEKNTPSGPILEPILNAEIQNPASQITTGDKLVVRIVLTVDRDLEFVHMKDMRASGLEPAPPAFSLKQGGSADTGLSGYRYQEGLGYYQSTTDQATNFFFDQLPKGIYVFEYPLKANAAGAYSNGITTIQCMYAPEFTAHSEGIRINVK